MNRRGLVSLQPYHSVPTLREKLSAYFNIIVMAGLNSFTLLGRRLKPAGSFGPCIVCSRQDYFKAGGHEYVKHDIVEDVALGRRFIDCGIPVSNYGGRKILSFRMYPGRIGELVEGWTRSMASGAAGTRPWIFALVILWLSGSTASIFLPFLASAFPGLPLYIVGPGIYLAYSLQLYWILRRVGSFSAVTALLYPIPLLFFHFIFLYSFYLTAFKKSVKWRGRQVDLKERDIGEDDA
jgi:4,4'-diaponeurosporenoate glycosyltransferase